MFLTVIPSRVGNLKNLGEAKILPAGFTISGLLRSRKTCFKFTRQCYHIERVIWPLSSVVRNTALKQITTQLKLRDQVTQLWCRMRRSRRRKLEMLSQSPPQTPEASLNSARSVSPGFTTAGTGGKSFFPVRNIGKDFPEFPSFLPERTHLGHDKFS